MKTLMCVRGELDEDFSVRIDVSLDTSMPEEIFNDVVTSVLNTFNAYQKEVKRKNENKEFSEIKNPLVSNVTY